MDTETLVWDPVGGLFVDTKAHLWDSETLSWIPPLMRVGDADAAAFVTAAGLSDHDQLAAVDALVIALKDAGLWDKMTAVYPFIGGTAETHKFNLKDPRDADSAFRLTFAGPIVHSATGAKPNGVDECYADTHCIPANELQLNSLHESYYSRTESATGDKAEMGAFNSPSGGLRLHLICHYAGDLFYFGVNELGASNCTMTTSQGLFAQSRTAADQTDGFHNGVQVGTSSTASSTLPDIPIYVLQLNGYPQGVTDRECAFATIGRGLDDTELSALYAITQDFQTALGRQV